MPVQPVPHGTVAGYRGTQHRRTHQTMRPPCRCAPCTTAWTDYKEQHRRSRLTPQDDFVPVVVASGPACAHPSVDPDWFFPLDAVDMTPADPIDNRRNTRRAVAVCQACPIRQSCLDENLTAEFGIFGGKTPLQRRRLAADKGIAWPPTQRAHVDEIAVDRAMAFESPALTRAEKIEVATRMIRAGYVYDDIEAASRLNGGEIATIRRIA